MEIVRDVLVFSTGFGFFFARDEEFFKAKKIECWFSFSEILEASFLHSFSETICFAAVVISTKIS